MLRKRGQPLCKSEYQEIYAPQQEQNVQQLREVTASTAARPELWRDALPAEDGVRPFMSRHNSEHFGIWVIGWRVEDADTRCHNHDGSRGYVHVVQGAIRLEHLTF